MTLCHIPPTAKELNKFICILHTIYIISYIVTTLVMFPKGAFIKLFQRYVIKHEEIIKFSMYSPIGLLISNFNYQKKQFNG